MHTEETPFSIYTVDDRGMVVNEVGKPLAEVLRYLTFALKKAKALKSLDYFELSSTAHPQEPWPIDAWIAVFCVAGDSEGYYVHVDAVWRQKWSDESSRHKHLLLGKAWNLKDAMRAVVALTRGIYGRGLPY